MKKIIFSDFDGTLTYKHELGAIFFDILKIIDSVNSELVIVSGRSISWGHFLLTHFPVNYVIMEGGGVILQKDENRIISEHLLINKKKIEQLEDVTKRLMKKYPNTKLSEDSFGRKTDRAIEFPEMSEEDLQNAIKFLDAEEEVNYSKSNVHLNFWVGNISKYDAVMDFLKYFMSDNRAEDCIYFGDAKNDESMFEKFPESVGVSNISKIIDELEFKPSIVLKGKENEGAFGVLNHLKTIFNFSED